MLSIGAFALWETQWLEEFWSWNDAREYYFKSP